MNIFFNKPKTQEQLNKELIGAASKGKTDKVKTLISNGADVNAKDNQGWTALHHASHNGHTETAKFLISKGVEVNVKDNHDCTTLHIASSNGHTETAKFLISKGADIHAKDISGNTSLHNASFIGYIETAKLLIESGADIYAKNNNGKTAEDLARKHGCENIAELLKNVSERQKALKETEEQLVHQKKMHDALRRNDVSTMSDRDFLDMLESEITDKK